MAWNIFADLWQRRGTFFYLEAEFYVRMDSRRRVRIICAPRITCTVYVTGNNFYAADAWLTGAALCGVCITENKSMEKY